MKDINFVGKINREIFKVVTSDIQTDEVIITAERIQHIKNNHPGDYESFGIYLQEIVEAPDYILEANKPRSAMILKSFSDGAELFKTIIRFNTSNDNPEYKNSIITFIKIDKAEWQRLINRKKVLYKRE